MRRLIVVLETWTLWAVIRIETSCTSQSARYEYRNVAGKNELNRSEKNACDAVSSKQAHDRVRNEDIYKDAMQGHWYSGRHWEREPFKAK